MSFIRSVCSFFGTVLTFAPQFLLFVLLHISSNSTDVGIFYNYVALL